MRNLIVLTSFITTLVSVLPTFAASTNVNCTADTALFETDPDNNLGAQTFMPVGYTSDGKRGRGLLRFDLSPIPTNATVTSASLAVKVVAGNGGVNLSFNLHRLLKSWIEGTKSGGPSPGTGVIGAAASTGEPTWNNRAHPSTTWGATGALSGTDYFSTSSSSITVIALGTYTFTNLAADVQKWIQIPSTNFGWLLKDSTESQLGSARRFGSREDSANKPVLTVTYTLPPTITSISKTNNQIRFSFSADTNVTYTVQSTASLFPTNWVTLTNFTSTNVVTTRVVSDTLAGASKFYRVKSP